MPGVVAFQLWRVLEQLAPEIFLNFFFKTGDLFMVHLTQKIQKREKTPKMHVQAQKGQYLFIYEAFGVILMHNNSLISKSKVKSKICQK